ncbi:MULTISPECIES: universal stress protein [Sphingobacterium]|uniref:Universal stress protein n=1 Tax=Sphingobacterium populi TaxID=1812824 RepID=A0ABW5UFI0_9SPHI|nr:universal stress protein [Sphingobacterium sp. CFCC 11742]
MENKFERILIALDDSPCSEKAAEYAKQLVNGWHSTVALLTVTPVTAPTNFGADPLLGQQPIIVPEVSEVQQNSAERRLENLRSQFSGAKEVRIFNTVGTVRDEILTTADEWQADLIIMGTNGRSGFDHFLSGSVAESVIRKSKCPVLVVPADDEED